MVRFSSDEVTVLTPSSDQPDQKEPPKDRTACLIVLSGTNVGKVYPLNKDQVTIGREDGADIQLMDAGISRRHAAVFRQGSSFLVNDVGSRNGTFANNHRLDSPHQLRDGDKLQVGVMTILKFSYGDDLEANYARKMYDAALRDDLTGVFNRRYFDDRVRSEFSFAKRHGTALALLMIDLDHFKRINDTRGHVAGDQVLRDFAQRMLQIIRAEDVLSRYGGEEFCVLCRNTELMQASTLAERIRHDTSAVPFQLPDGPLTVTVSIGVVASDDTLASPEEMVEAADEALYQAKTRGRNCVVTRRPKRGG